jgi:N-acetylglucosaminyldiphosphoundecaprenol N-acetyl-beta-D-mannosaminyltransferase
VTLPKRIAVIDSHLSDCDRGTALEILARSVREGRGGYVCFTNVHMAVMGRRDESIRGITNDSLLSMADGKPLYWVGRMKGARRIAHSPGPDVMLETLRRFADRGHFFFGSTPAVLARLEAGLRELVPGIRICGTLSPPFRELNAEEVRAHHALIRASGAEFVWVGLGAPKQEKWMAEAWRELQPAVLLGVGAAFDFYAGTLRRAPRYMRRAGLEWLYRLSQEPRRLWKRYLVTNSLFIRYALTDALRGR